jgi:hypothetical protein
MVAFDLLALEEARYGKGLITYSAERVYGTRSVIEAVERCCGIR